MKLINILSIVCLLFIAASCSMEDDLLDRVDTPDNNKEKNEAYAYADFEFSLATSSNVQTRSSSDEVNYVVEDWIPNTIDLGTINGTTVQ